MWAKSLLLSAAVAAGAVVAPVNAAGPPVQLIEPGWVVPTQGRREGSQNIRSLREVVEEMRARYGGELISARLEDGPRPFYVLRWRMPDGEVRDFRVSAAR